MMRPSLNRRGCLIIVLLIAVAIAAILWLAQEARPAREGAGIPMRALEKSGPTIP